LLASFDPQRNVVAGRWALTPAGLVPTGKSEGLAKRRAPGIQFTPDLPAEFNVAAEFTVDEFREDGGVQLIVPAGGHHYQWMLGTRGNSVARLVTSPTSFVHMVSRQPFFQPHSRHRVVVKIRRQVMSIDLDGAQLCRRNFEKLQGRRYEGYRDGAIGFWTDDLITLHKLVLVPVRP
jgi:hypothetical protein